MQHAVPKASTVSPSPPGEATLPKPHTPKPTPHRATMLHTIKLKAVVDKSLQLHLQLPPDTPVGEAEVIVLVTPATATVSAAPMASLREFFAELDARPQTHPRSREEIESQIAEERASWD